MGTPISRYCTDNYPIIPTASTLSKRVSTTGAPDTTQFKKTYEYNIKLYSDKHGVGRSSLINSLTNGTGKIDIVYRNARYILNFTKIDDIIHFSESNEFYIYVIESNNNFRQKLKDVVLPEHLDGMRSCIWSMVIGTKHDLLGDIELRAEELCRSNGDHPYYVETSIKYNCVTAAKGSMTDLLQWILRTMHYLSWNNKYYFPTLKDRLLGTVVPN